MRFDSTFHHRTSSRFARSATVDAFGKFYVHPADAGFRDRLPHERPGVSNRWGPINNRLHAALHGDAK